MTICLIIRFNLHIEMELFTQRVSFWFIQSSHRNWNNMRNNISLVSFFHIQILLSAEGKLLQWTSYFIFSSFSYFCVAFSLKLQETTYLRILIPRMEHAYLIISMEKWFVTSYKLKKVYDFVIWLLFSSVWP